ncbi:Serine/threonine-protein kinase PknD [Actinomadura sp. RB99]|uniref:WD40 repeat domain-containing serine/threonine protein kinase n=1 Tax=Actinomadura sp. RB99 TaxID=2691577 RepID=UPI0016893902|nr:serine/threonine-protein kinase [Actinomadura sp. RB99]MBD2891558.1 Serine/threonine-protein kinase PknD [Actinomadura sp. RB99]
MRPGDRGLAAAGDAWRVGQVVDGRYEVMQVHEGGAMGVVYRVRHLEWATDLAVKCPRAELFAREAQRDWFVAEAEIWVSLGLHPNVCGCHYVRVLDGVPRVFAEYVPGGSLRDWIDDRRLYSGGRDEALVRILDVAVQFAWGLAHAHDRGVVHQDVKPANVLMDGTPDGAVAKVTDFGLAKARAVAGPVAAAPTASDTPPEASIMVSTSGLTPAYASPEQAAGLPVGRRTDIYSFAVSVLEMFTGGLAWRSGTAAGAALSACRADPAPGIPGLPPELADLLDGCLKPDPAERPASLTEVAAELAEIHRRAAGTSRPRPAPVVADLRADELSNRGVSLLDLGRPAEAGEAFAAALAADPQHLNATYNAGLLRWRRGECTDEDLVSALDSTVSGGTDPDGAHRLLAQVHRERGDHDRADAMLGRDGPARSRPSNGTRRIPWYSYQERVETFDGMRIPRQPPTMGVRFTGDGRRAVVACDGVLRVWDVGDGRCLTELTAPGVEFTLGISGDGRSAITAGPDAVHFWDLAGGRRLRAIGAPGGWNRALWSSSVCLSADGRTAASAAYDGTVLVWDFPGGGLRLAIDGHQGRAVTALDAEGRLVLTAGRADGTARLWDVATGRCVRVLDARVRDGFKAVDEVCLSADGSRAALAAGGRIRLWDLRTGDVRTLPGHARIVRSLSMSDGFLISVGADDTVRLWTLDGGQCLRTYRGDGPVRAAHLVPDTGVLLSAWRSGLRWWTVPPRHTAPFQLSRPREHAELSGLDAAVTDLMDRAREADPRTALSLLAEARSVPGHERDPRLLDAWRALGRSATRTGLRSAWPAGVFESGAAPVSVDPHPDGRTALAGGQDGTVRLWDVENGTRLRTFAKHPSAVNAVAVSRDGSRAAAVSRDGTVSAWALPTGERVETIERLGPLGAGAAAFDQDARRAVVAGADAVIRIWNLDTGACERELPGHTGRITALHTAPELIASAGADGTVRLWNPETGECLRVLHGHTNWVMSACVSPDGRRVLSAGGYTDRTIRLWDTATGECLRVFGDEPDNPRGVDSVPKVRSKRVRFTPDGRFAVSGGSDAAVRIWDLGGGRCLRVLDGHTGAVNAVAISADARFALSASTDGTLRRWELDWNLHTP